MHHEGWCHTHVECMCMLTNAKRHEPNRKSTGWLNSAKANINRWPIFLNTSVMYHTFLIESHLQVILKRTKYYNWKTFVRNGTKGFEFPFTDCYIQSDTFAAWMYNCYQLAMPSLSREPPISWPCLACHMVCCYQVPMPCLSRGVLLSKPRFIFYLVMHNLAQLFISPPPPRS